MDGRGTERWRRKRREMAERMDPMIIRRLRRVELSLWLIMGRSAELRSLENGAKHDWILTWPSRRKFRVLSSGRKGDDPFAVCRRPFL
jgi:hypothetical protein